MPSSFPSTFPLFYDEKILIIAYVCTQATTGF